MDKGGGCPLLLPDRASSLGPAKYHSAIICTCVRKRGLSQDYVLGGRGRCPLGQLVEEMQRTRS